MTVRKQMEDTIKRVLEVMRIGPLDSEALAQLNLSQLKWIQWGMSNEDIVKVTSIIAVIAHFRKEIKGIENPYKADRGHIRQHMACEEFRQAVLGLLGNEEK